MRCAAFPPDHPVLHTPAIWHPDAAGAQRRRDDFAVVCFRRRFALRTRARAALWISASQRFELHVDGTLIARGPARSDPLRWNVARVRLDLAAGSHVLAVRVVHFGSHGGAGQLGGPAFLLVRGDGALAGVVDSGTQWRCLADRSRTPVDAHEWGGKGRYYPVGCGETLDLSASPHGWSQRRHDDRAWPAAAVVAGEAADAWGNLHLRHRLRPDPLPAMEEWPIAPARIADAPADLRAAAAAWLAGRQDLTIAPHRDVRVVVDAGEPVNVHPTLLLSGGRGARIDYVAAEAAYAPDGTKGDRDDVAGKALYGHRGAILPDGGERRLCDTLWLRSFRYLDLRVRTAGQALALGPLRLTASAFPLRRRARFLAAGALAEDWQGLLSACWRTIRLCAHENLWDCPHFEQCQFPGDSRIQALYHYAVCGDDRLPRQAIDAFAGSRLHDGMLQCRWPSALDQILPTFALHWLGMLDDFRRWRGDRAFLAAYLPVARDALAWFLDRRRADGLLARIPHAPFVDWAPAFLPYGNAPQAKDGGSAVLSLMTARACGALAALEAACGWRELAPRWRAEQRALLAAVRRQCRRADGLIADVAGRRSASVHAAVEAVLAGLVAGRAAARLLARALADPAVAQPGTYYYRAHLLLAARQVGWPALLHDQLARWTGALRASNLRTLPESEGDRPRSDCHAWSVAPGYEALTTVLGVEPTADALGCDRLRFAPCLGPLPAASGRLPTPHGPVDVRLRRAGARVHAEISAPVAVEVPALRRRLRAGRHALTLPA